MLKLEVPFFGCNLERLDHVDMINYRVSPIRVSAK